MLPLSVRQEVMHAICWTLIHSLWLGILAAMLAGIVIICTRKLPVVIRYRLLAMDLVLFVLAVGITFCYQLKQGEVAGSQTLVSATMKQTIVAESGSANPGRSLADQQASADHQLLANYWSLLDYQPVVNYLNRHAFIIVDIWLICLFIQLSRLMAGLYGIGRLRRTGTSPSDKWNDTLLLLSGQLGLKRRVGLLESASVKIPAAIGVFKPVILVPLGILSNLPAEQVETVLLHELAHIKRGDYLTNLLLHITEAVFFFNPGLRWLNALIRREREACCDDMVLAVTPDRTIYLDALVSFREYLKGKTSLNYTVALGKGRKSLLWRVQRILANENKNLDIMEKTILSFGLAAVIAVGLISMKPAQTDTLRPVNISAPVPPPPVPAATVKADIPPPALMVTPTTPRPTARTIKDTLPVRDTLHRQLRRDSPIIQRDSLDILKRETERNNLEVQSYLYDAVKQHLAEEQEMRSKLLKDTLSRLNPNTMSKDDILKLANHDIQLSIDQQLLNNQIAKLAEDRARIVNDHAQIVEDEPSGNSDRRIQGITNSLLEAGLIPDDKTFSFSLNSERLLVNDKTAPAPIFQKLKERYLHSPRDHFNYMKHGGNTVTNISETRD
jgi:bla regulator protein BlaR1